MRKLTREIKAFKSRLTSVRREEPLNKLSLATIILLDLFILSLVFTGLNEHTQQLTTAGEYLPTAAREIFIQQHWTPTVRISKLQPLILTDRNNYRYRHSSPFEETAIQRMHPASRTFFQQVKTLSEDVPLHALFLSRQKLTDERGKTEKAFHKAKESYDTQLLENIANGAQPGSDATAATARHYSQNINQLNLEIRATEKQIEAHPGIQTLWILITPNDSERATIVSEFKHFEFWFPLKELAWQLLFLLPIFGLFYAWSVRSVKKDNAIQTLIASHLLVIASLPIILKIVELVVDLIPRHFFKKLFEILESLHLMALWHYVVISGAIAAGLFLVYFIQRKVFNPQKVMQKRLMKNACIHCNKKLPTGAKFCPFCAGRQVETCPACHEDTPIAGTCCIHCGAPR